MHTMHYDGRCPDSHPSVLKLAISKVRMKAERSLGRCGWLSATHIDAQNGPQDRTKVRFSFGIAMESANKVLDCVKIVLTH